MSESLEEYLKRADRRAQRYFELIKQGYSKEEAKKKVLEEIPEEGISN